MKKTTTICFANNKGGSGKSTTCSNVGFSLAESGKKVLMLDGDMQLNLSLSFFDEDTVLEMAQSEKNLYTAIKEQKDLTEFIVKTKYENLDLLLRESKDNRKRREGSLPNRPRWEARQLKCNHTFRFPEYF